MSKEYGYNNFQNNVECNDKKKVFISMIMNNQTYGSKLIEEIRKGIRKGIEDTNNKPFCIDIDNLNDDFICNTLIKEINSCKFLVADLTKLNAGVYFEIGYAMGIGKKIIYTCKVGAKPHFNIIQKPIIFWHNSYDLAKKLTEIIIKLNLGEKNNEESKNK